MAIPEGLSFDELNTLYRKEHDLRSLPFEQFFGEMDLSAEQKDRRIQTAKDIKKFTLYALMSMYYMWQEGLYDYSEPISEFQNEYQSLLDRLDVPLTDFFAGVHAISTANEIASATLNHPDEMYFFSEDRAALIAENEANSIWNDSEYQDAILSGKTSKRWVAIIDKVTRDSHRDVNGAVVAIDEPFYVGDSLMMYPHDESMGAGAEEIVNCRCSVMYY